jgi:hypothetical protein
MQFAGADLKQSLATAGALAPLFLSNKLGSFSVNADRSRKLKCSVSMSSVRDQQKWLAREGGRQREGFESDDLFKTQAYEGGVSLNSRWIYSCYPFRYVCSVARFRGLGSVVDCHLGFRCAPPQALRCRLLCRLGTRIIL